jgi:hypothetical protein
LTRTCPCLVVVVVRGSYPILYTQTRRLERRVYTFGEDDPSMYHFVADVEPASLV